MNPIQGIRVPSAMLSETCILLFFVSDSSSLSWTKAVSMEPDADEVLELEAEEEGARRLFNKHRHVKHA